MGELGVYTRINKREGNGKKKNTNLEYHSAQLGR